MKKILIILSIGMIFFASCERFKIIRPSGRVTTEERIVEEFTKISTSSGIKVVLYTGTQNVVVEAHQNQHEYIETYVAAGCLFVKPRPHVSFGGKSHITVYITSEYIHSVEASGGSKVEIPYGISADNITLDGSGGSKFEGIVGANYLKISLSGGGEAELNIDCDRLDAKGSGGSEFEMWGEAGIMHISLSGGGDFEGFDLHANELDVNLSGGAKAEVNVSEYISGNLSGGSRLEYRGAPGVSVQTSGGSRVINVN